MPLLPPLATPVRRGLVVLSAALLALTTGCNFILGVPEVTSVDVNLQPKDSIAVGGTTNAVVTVHGSGGKILNIAGTKLTVAFASNNPSVAVVNSTTGVITAAGEGTATISATVRSHTGTTTVVVTPEVPVRVDPQPPTLVLGSGRVQLVITAIGQSGQSLGKRPVTVNSSNTNIVTVETDGTTTGTYLRPVSVGTAQITGNVQGVSFGVNVTVQPQPPARITGQLQKGSNSLLVGESNQVAVSLFAADNSPISTANQSIGFLSEDQTVAAVSPTGVVTGITPGTTVIDILVTGTTARGFVTITVQPKPARQVIIQNRSPFIRLGSNGTGVPSTRAAVALDSVGQTIPNRLISYRSTDPSVFLVGPLGVVTGQKLGNAKLIASADNGAVADTVALTVTEVPIVNVTVTPLQVPGILPGATQQFTAALTDSLGVTVAGRPVQWQSNNPNAMTIDPNTGLATAISPGNVTISAIAFVVPGLPGQLAGQASALVLPTPIASIDVQPASVTVKAGSSTLVAITVKDAKGNILFGRASSIAVTSDAPGIAFGDNQGNVHGVTAGRATITYQALDINGNAIPGVVTTISVLVN